MSQPSLYRFQAFTPARATLVVAFASVLGIYPIGALFTDLRWLMESIGAILVVIVPAALIRWRTGLCRVSDLAPGIVLLVVYVTTLYLHHGAFAGVFPGGGTGQRLQDLLQDNRSVIRDGSTPLRSTAGLRLFVVPAAALIAALTDLLTNVHRAPAIAGVGFLATFTVVGAVHGSAVGWWQFTVSAVGYLIILVVATRRDTAEWGRLVPRSGQRGRDLSLQLSTSGARIGAIAVIAAVLLPSLLPGLSRNLLADAFHKGKGGGKGGSTISAFAGLTGQLRDKAVTNEFRVNVDGTKTPFYIKLKTLDVFTSAGWRPGPDPINPVAPTAREFAQELNPDVPTRNYTANFSILSMRDALGFFAAPRSFSDLRRHWSWDQDRQNFVNATTEGDERYTEQVSELTPTAEQLRSATSHARRQGTDAVPASVRTQVTQIIRGADNAYERSIAILNFFSPRNGFIYDLQTQSGDTGSALGDFLKNRKGYCQQYAATMAIMLRLAGIDSRVVLGYTHDRLDNDGSVVVTSHDAHAWVEARFDGIGWLPFDPTPLLGSDAARAVAPAWAPQTSSSSASTSQSREATVSKPNTEASQSRTSAAPSDTAGGAPGSSSGPPVAALAGVAGGVLIVLLAALPAILRRRQRVSRLSHAHAERRYTPVWQELQASVTDAGLTWPGTTTPRQVPKWLSRHGLQEWQRLTDLSLGTERELYADPANRGPGQDVDPAVDAVRATRRALIARLPLHRRILARLWPASTMSRAARRSARRRH